MKTQVQISDDNKARFLAAMKKDRDEATSELKTVKAKYKNMCAPKERSFLCFKWMSARRIPGIHDVIYFRLRGLRKRLVAVQDMIMLLGHEDIVYLSDVDYVWCVRTTLAFPSRD